MQGEQDTQAAPPGGLEPREEFEALLAPHFGALHGFALRLTRNATDAEDLLQEGLYLAFRGLGSFRRGTNFKAWVFRIVTNAFISRQRAQKRAPLLVPELEAVDTSSALEQELRDAQVDWDEVFSESVEDELKQAIDELPPEFRLPLLLSSLGGMRYKEISDLLEVPIGTVMSRLFRARKRLRKSLVDYASARGIVIQGA